MNPLLNHLARAQKSFDRAIRRTVLSFIESLSTEMKAVRVTKSELAEKMCVSRPYITHALSGEANLTIESMVKFAHALDCDVHIAFQRRKPYSPEGGVNTPFALQVVNGWRESTISNASARAPKRGRRPFLALFAFVKAA